MWKLLSSHSAAGENERILRLASAIVRRASTRTRAFSRNRGRSLRPRFPGANRLLGRERRGELLQLLHRKQIAANGIAGRLHHPLLTTAKKMPSRKPARQGLESQTDQAVGGTDICRLLITALDTGDGLRFGLRIGLDLGVGNLPSQSHDAVGDIDVDVHDVRETIDGQLRHDCGVNGSIVDLAPRALRRRAAHNEESQRQGDRESQDSSGTTIHGFL
jgi:hypothetical protein